MKEVFITKKIPAAGIRHLENSGLKVRLNDSETDLSPEKIVECASGAEAIISLLSDSFDQSLISRLQSLKVISNYAVGYNNIDVSFCREKGIFVTNTPGVLTDTTADLGFALLTAVARRIPEAHNFTVNGCFKGWGAELLLGRDIHRKTLGIIGLGRIGQAIAKRASGFDMKILYYSRTRKDELEKSLGYEYRQPEDLAAESDFIMICCPLTDETTHLVGRNFLPRMKQTSYLVNISRGPVVDESLLTEYLRSGKIAGAGFDVYEHEPRISPELLALKNVVLLPHIGSASIETRNIMAELAADNVIDVLVHSRTPRSNVY